jgi:hypothetical protein
LIISAVESWIPEKKKKERKKKEKPSNVKGRMQEGPTKVP